MVLGAIIICTVHHQYHEVTRVQPEIGDMTAKDERIRSLLLTPAIGASMEEVANTIERQRTCNDKDGRRVRCGLVEDQDKQSV